MQQSKQRVEFKDEFSFPQFAKKDHQTSSSMSSSTPGDCEKDHIWERKADMFGENAKRETGNSRLCYTCHATKAEFSHDNGQHIDNSSYLLHKVSALFQNADLSDIQVIVGHKVFHSHKLLLCSSSDVFRVMLTNPSWPESQCHKIVLTEEPQCIQVFDDFLKYIYTGNIHLTHYSALPVLMLADKYNVCDLRAVCLEYMSEHLVSTVEHNHAVSWMQYCYACGHNSLAKACYEFILWNFHKVMATSDFLLIEKDLMLDFISHSDLVVPDEFTLFGGVCRWLDHQRTSCEDSSSEEFNSLALSILSSIRYPMIGPVQLSHLEQSELAEKFADFLLTKMVWAMNYHAAPRELPPEISDLSSDQYTPRNYTNDMWSTSLSIDNYSTLPEHDVRPLFFSSPVSGAQVDENKCWEWNVDLFPKGIQFQKCIMIGLWRNLEIGGAIYNSVRLVLATKMAEVRNVDVAVLIKGVQDNVEFVKRVVDRRCMFDHETRLCQFSDIVPFEELNGAHSEYLTGQESDSFKISIIIKPV